ncbi:protein ECT2-like isoform X2 [Ciona intestinalis]
MRITQMETAIGLLAGCSLFLHLCTAGNFIPPTEVGFIGSLFGYLHSICNLIARISLLSGVLLIIVEAKFPSMVSSYTHVQQHLLPKYLSKMLIASLLFTAVRLIIPGPVTYFSKLYKLCILTNLISAGLAVLNANSYSHSSSVSVRWRPKSTDVKKPEIKRSSSSDADVPTKRHRTAMELLQTETTYLRNLNTILKVYKEPLQKAADEGKPLLAPEDIRNAFGGIDDIAKLHACIHQDLSEMIDNWEEDCCIAHIFTKYREQLLKVYPPYVNYFDMGKEILMKQEKANPELGEFFLACFHEPQSLKQPLNALLIRPVQRLPSISLLINDLHKRTDDGLKDKTELEEAKKVLKQVLSHINEDKRKTEGKMKIFDIVYEVDGCPVEVVSSNRLFVSRVDVATLTDGLYRSGERLALYLLTDVLEVAKWRNRSHGKSAPLLKHIQLLPLSNIISIWDVQDNDECKNLFAVKYKSQGNAIIDGSVNGQEEKLSVLQLLDDRTFKSKWLKALTAQIAEVKQEKVESVMKQVEPMELAGHVKKGSKILKKLTRVKPKAE